MRIKKCLELRSWLAAGLTVLALAAGGRLAAQESAQGPKTEAAWEAVAILFDNQKRCMKLARSKLGILRSHDGAKREAEVAYLLDNQDRTRVQTIENALGIAQRLAARTDAGPFAVAATIRTMLNEQDRLCDWATSPYSSGEAVAYGQQIREQDYKFEKASRDLPQSLQLRASEIHEVVERYRHELFDVGEDLSDAAVTRSIAEADRGLPYEPPPLTAEEYQRKKQEYDDWMAEQERQKAEKSRRQAQRREEAKQRQAQGERELPKVELKQPDESEPPLAAEAGEMAQWHAGYSEKVKPFKQSLSQFLSVQGPSRTMIMLRSCQDLSRSARDVLEDPAALNAPDPAAAKALNNSLVLFKQAADLCIGNRLQQSRDSIQKGERYLGLAMAALKPYGLGL